MATEWHYSKGGQQHGPVSAADLKALAKSGELLPTDMIWKEGMAEWRPAGSLKGLFPHIAAPAPQKAPPPLPTNSSVKSSVIDVVAGHIGFVAYRRYFATAIDKLYDKGGPELPPKFPWTSEERAAPNPKHLWAKFGIGACIAIGIVCLLSIVGAIFCLPFFSAAILIYVFGINKRLFHGRWLPSAGKGWIEFLPGHVVKREDGTVGSFALLPNQQFIDFLDNGRLVDCWKVLAFEHSTHLEVVNLAGKTLNFKRAKIGVYKGSSIFNTSRSSLIKGSWQPISEEDEWMQFTEDGAVVFSNGSAGRFTINGDEPNELVRLELIGGETREFKIVSLTTNQLVIAEGDEATTFLRPKHPSTKTEKNMEASTHESASQGTPIASDDQRHYLDCPNCGKSYYVNQVDPSQRIDCSDCDKWFLVKDALNVRTSAERVETKGFFQRLWSGSSIQKSNRERLESTAKTYQAIIRSEELKGNFQAAQLWQLRLNEVMRQLADL